MSNLIKVLGEGGSLAITSVKCARTDLISGCHGSSRYVIKSQYLTRDFLGNSKHEYFYDTIMLIIKIKIQTKYKQW